MTLSKEGLYCITVSAYSSSAINTGDSIVKSSYHYNTSLKFKEYIIYSNGSNIITYSYDGATFYGLMTLIYIGTFSDAQLANYNVIYDTTAVQTRTFSTQNQFIHHFACGGTKYSQDYTATNIENNNITIYNPGTTNSYSMGCINYNGNITCRGIPGPHSGNVGTLSFTSYNLIR